MENSGRILPVDGGAKEDHGAAEPALPERYREQVQGRLVGFVYENIPIQVVELPFVAALVVWAFWGIHGHRLLTLWFSAVVAGVVARLALWRAYRRVSPPASDAEKWGRFHALNMLYHGVAWGVAGFFFLDFQHPQATMVLTIVIAALAAGAFTSLLPYLLSYVAFSLFAVIPTALRYFLEGGQANIMLGIGCLIFLAILFIYARRSHRHLRDSIILQLEKQDLVAELTHQREQAEQAREEAEQANLAKSKFLAAASHDLRQPLHALRLFVDALDSRVRDTERRGIVDNIMASTEALEELLNNLLDLSRLEAQVVKPVVTDFPLQTLLGRLVREYGPLADQKGLTLRAVKTSAIVRSDMALLERILRNLIVNAIRYTKAGKILVGCRRQKEGIGVQVWDTGIGIPSDQISSVFTEFHQLENPERDRTKGLGLGLAIAEGLARLLGQQVTVSSVLGKGSCFGIALPVGKVAVAALGETVLESVRNRLAGCRVAVIDDDEAVRKGMAQMLSDWECRAVIGETVAAVLTQLKIDGTRPDLLISDYRLRAATNGTEAIEAVRRRYAYPIPAIIVTGDTAPDRLREAENSGCRLMHKPVKPAKLRLLMEQLLGQDNQPIIS